MSVAASWNGCPVNTSEFSLQAGENHVKLSFGRLPAGIQRPFVKHYIVSAAEQAVQRCGWLHIRFAELQMDGLNGGRQTRLLDGGWVTAS
jgi:hypothetical protein